MTKYEENAILRLHSLDGLDPCNLAQMYTPAEIAEGCLMTRGEAVLLATLHGCTEGALYDVIGRQDDYLAFDVARALGCDQVMR